MNDDMYISDDQWKKLKTFLPGQHGAPGIPSKNSRLFIEAVLWLIKEEGTWNHLPKKFGGAWNTIYMRFRRWSASGVWEHLAQIDIDDTELLVLLEHINNFSLQYLERPIRRQEIKRLQARKQISTPIKNCQSLSPPTPSTNWLWLISSEWGSQTPPHQTMSLVNTDVL